MTNKELRRQVIEYVSGIQTGVLSHTETTDGLLALIAKSNNEARIDELEATGIDILIAHTVGEQHKIRDDRLQQLKKGDNEPELTYERCDYCRMKDREYTPECEKNK